MIGKQERIKEETLKKIKEYEAKKQLDEER